MRPAVVILRHEVTQLLVRPVAPRVDTTILRRAVAAPLAVTVRLARPAVAHREVARVEATAAVVGTAVAATPAEAAGTITKTSRII